VHQCYGRPHGGTGDQQVATRQLGVGRCPEGTARSCGGEHEGHDRQGHVIGDRHAGLKPEHGDKMHGPDAATHAEAGGYQPKQATDLKAFADPLQQAQ